MVQLEVAMGNGFLLLTVRYLCSFIQSSGIFSRNVQLSFIFHWIDLISVRGYLVITRF